MRVVDFNWNKELSLLKILFYFYIIRLGGGRVFSKTQGSDLNEIANLRHNTSHRMLCAVLRSLIMNGLAHTHTHILCPHESESAPSCRGHMIPPTTTHPAKVIHSLSPRGQRVSLEGHFMPQNLERHPLCAHLLLHVPLGKWNHVKLTHLRSSSTILGPPHPPPPIKFELHMPSSSDYILACWNLLVFQ